MKKFLSNFLLILSICGVCISGYKLYSIFSEYHSGTQTYEELEKQIKIKKEEKTEEKTEEEITLDINFENLKKINSNCIGWIYIPNTRINYPIVQSTDNDYCLHHTFDGTKNFTGSIFVSNQNDNFNDQNTIIYGHNMQNGTMFTDIKKYKEQDFLDSNPYIYIAKPNGTTEKYKIFAAYITEDCSDAYMIQFATDTFLNEIENMRNRSIVKISDFTISNKDKIITLSTCTSRTELERFVVHAVKVN